MSTGTAPFAIELRPEPVITLDGQVYRWRRLRRISHCPCPAELLCHRSVDAGEPAFCEEPFEPELTGDGWAEKGPL